MDLKDAYFVDGVRTWFGKARPDGFFAGTRADDMVGKCILELRKRNPQIDFLTFDDCVVGATTQIGDQGTTMGRTVTMSAGLGFGVPGVSLDRMCAGGMTAQTYAASQIKVGAASKVIAAGVEHMAHHPMGQGADPNPRIIAEKMVEPKYFNMGCTAERLHDWLVENGYPEVTKEECDLYAYTTTKKYFAALEAGFFKGQTVDMMVWGPNGWKVADRDEQPRADISLESMAKLKTPFKVGGKVTPGNASGLNDGACASIFLSGEECKNLGVKPKMRMVSYAFAGVDPSIMGFGPVPATDKALKNAGLTFKDIDIVELNEAFAVQAVAFAKYYGLSLPHDDRMNPNGGAIAIGHPLASSGVRLSIQLAKYFEQNPSARYGLTTMCIGLGMGATVIWENCVGKDF